MPIPASPFTSIAPGLGGQAQPLDPRQLFSALQAIPGMGASQGPDPSPVPPSRQMTPPTNDMSASLGPPSYGAAPQAGSGQDEMDLFQRVAMLLMDPESRQLNMPMVLLFAGMGMREALEKTGKFKTKPHRSNEELASQGMDVGIPGQTGLQDPAQMTRSLQVSVPGGVR